jgi:hypothetical protein
MGHNLPERLDQASAVQGRGIEEFLSNVCQEGPQQHPDCNRQVQAV